jgi:hypothetical protein
MQLIGIWFSLKCPPPSLSLLLFSFHPDPQSSGARLRWKPDPDADPLLLPGRGEVFGSLAWGQRGQLERHKMGHPGHAGVWPVWGSLRKYQYGLRGYRLLLLHDTIGAMQ